MTYDEAKKRAKEESEACEKKGIESVMTVVTHVNIEKHFESIGELIENYYRSKRIIENPMIVLFLQSKQYGIISNEESTPSSWVKRPYATYGSMDQVERILLRRR